MSDYPTDPSSQPRQQPPSQPPWQPRPTGPTPPRRRWPARHKIWTAVLSAVGLLIVLIIVGAAVGSSKTKSASNANSPAAPAARTTASATPKVRPVTLTAKEQKFVADMHNRYTITGTIGSATLVAIGERVCSDRRAGDSQVAVVNYVGHQLKTASASVARLAEKDLCYRYLPLPAKPKVIARPAPSTPAATTPAVVPVSLCGAPSNPYKLNLCGRGSLVYSPPSDVCSYFNCIPNFPNGIGYMVECNDGMYSMSGGRPGACSYHNGEGTAVTQG